MLEAVANCKLWIRPLRGKRPIVSDLSNDPTYSLALFQACGENVGLGLECRRNSLVVVDVDKRHDKDGFRFLPDWVQMRAGIVVKTPGGGKHFYFKAKNPKKLCGRRPGLDFKWKGYVVAPPTKGYIVERFGELCEWPLKASVEKRMGREVKSLGFLVVSKRCLLRLGWTPCGETDKGFLWRRPGKSRGVSGVLFKNSGIFYCFTTSDKVLREGFYRPRALRKIARLNQSRDRLMEAGGLPWHSN